MTSACSQFDKYRDGELIPAQRERFEAHLPGCGECRLRLRLLDNIVRTLSAEEPEVPKGFARRVAARAFAAAQSWDEILLSWFPPRKAWVAATLALCIFAAVVFVSSRSAAQTTDKYESLIEKSEKLIRSDKIQGYAEFRAAVIQRGETYD